MTPVPSGPPDPLPGTDQGWLWDPAIVFLNHGSFGSLPLAVAEAAERSRSPGSVGA
jgi:isopenicillin-N epimerase